MDYEIYKGYQIRPGTMDNYVVDEIGSYKSMLMRLVPADVVLDIGANIGSFSKAASTKVLRPVISVEPEPDNFELLMLNAPECLHIRAAVTDSDDGADVYLYKNKGTNKGLHSTVPTLRREITTVPSISFRSLLAEHQPTQIKIDCEGAEYSFLRPEKLPSHVRGIIMEYNLSRRGEQELAQALHLDFQIMKWNVERQPRFGTRAWATMAHYTR